jgi:hypothetical protein
MRVTSLLKEGYEEIEFQRKSIAKASVESKYIFRSQCCLGWDQFGEVTESLAVLY